MVVRRGHPMATGNHGEAPEEMVCLCSGFHCLILALGCLLGLDCGMVVPAGWAVGGGGDHGGSVVGRRWRRKWRRRGEGGCGTGSLRSEVEGRSPWSETAAAAGGDGCGEERDGGSCWSSERTVLHRSLSVAARTAGRRVHLVPSDSTLLSAAAVERLRAGSASASV